MADKKAELESPVRDIVLKFSCDDRPGIVANVAGFFRDQGFNIRESSQFEDRGSQRFFMRTVFEAVDGTSSLQQLRERFTPLAQSYGMEWLLQDKAYRLRVLVAVSKWDHCLNALLNSWKHGSLPIEIVGVFSNHPDLESLVSWYGLPYFYHPIGSHPIESHSKESHRTEQGPGSNKAHQEQQLLRVFREQKADLLVLARYMQILSDDLCRDLTGNAINIHHSFLPGFKGARPYHQAHARGVKLIGATAHYVTPELDEGPIIEQAVERVSHANTPEELTEIGRDIEAVVLQRAVRWHAEHRVLLNGDRTVVFNR